jgi:two-component system KDP operon response regulator KdpE
VKLLIADDDPQMVRALRITLAAHGYEVVVAADGAAAVAVAAQTHPDLIMLDLGVHIEKLESVRYYAGFPMSAHHVISGVKAKLEKVA